MDTLDKEEIYDDLVDHVEHQAQNDGGEAGALGPDLIAESQGSDGDNEANAPEINGD
jgi:hypothetical protein